MTDPNNPSLSPHLPLGREAAIAALRRYECQIRQLGVESLFLFGSTARDEADSCSDIDPFFDYRAGEFGVFELMEVKERLADLLGCKVDVMTRDSIHKSLRSRIEAEAVPVF